MCYKLESSFVLIHALKERKSCSIAEIVEIKRKVEEKISSVYLDVSRNSIQETISCYPEIFRWEDELVKRKENADSYFQDDIMAFFNCPDMDKTLESEVVRYIKSNG